MVIKRKDGSIYKLRKPNPLMENQNLDDSHKSIFPFSHDYIEIIIDKKRKKPDQPKSQLKNNEIKIIEPQLSKETQTQIPITILNYVPTTIKEYHDELYGETKYRTEYGNPGKIEAVISENEGIYLKLWSKTKMNKNTIIHEPKNRCWWQVSEYIEKDGWFKYHCLPSDLAPHFEEES